MNENDFCINIYEFDIDLNKKKLIHKTTKNGNIILNIHIVINKSIDINETLLSMKKVKFLDIDSIIVNNPSSNLNLNKLILKYCNIPSLLIYICNLNTNQLKFEPYQKEDEDIFTKYFKYCNGSNGKYPNKILEKLLKEMKMTYYSKDNNLNIKGIRSKINNEERKLSFITWILNLFFDYYMILENEKMLRGEDESNEKINYNILELNKWLYSKLNKINNIENITNERHDFVIYT